MQDSSSAPEVEPEPTIIDAEYETVETTTEPAPAETPEGGINVSIDTQKLADMIAKYGPESPQVIDAIATRAYNLRSEKLQSFFDSFGEEWQKNLTRADDRTWVGEFLEKYLPGYDYRTMQIGLDQMRSFMHFCAMFGIIDVSPEIEAKMRDLPGGGLAQLPLDKLAGLAGLKPLAAFLKTISTLRNTGDKMIPKVRTRVQEMVTEHAVEETVEDEHSEMKEVAYPPVELDDAANEPMEGAEEKEEAA